MFRSSGFSSGNGRPLRIPTRRIAPASMSSAAKATGGPPHRLGSLPSDLRRRRTGQARNVTGADDHGVDPGPLELGDLLAACDVEIRDRELAGRKIGKQVEHSLEGVVAVVLERRREEEDLGVEALEGPLELVGVA